MSTIEIGCQTRLMGNRHVDVRRRGWIRPDEIVLLACLLPPVSRTTGAAGTSSLVEERRLLRCRASHSRNRGSPRRQGFCLAVAGSAGTVGSADLRKAQDALQEAVNTRKGEKNMC